MKSLISLRTVTSNIENKFITTNTNTKRTRELHGKGEMNLGI